ncbi:hypothetical protein NL676_027285 [Syzygium grande]|nr:hypothetical protein NL676_027285 [Syzygium grande]
MGTYPVSFRFFGTCTMRFGSWVPNQIENRELDWESRSFFREGFQLSPSLQLSPVPISLLDGMSLFEKPGALSHQLREAGSSYSFAPKAKKHAHLVLLA